MLSENNWFGIDFGTTNCAVVSYTGIEGKDIHEIHYGDNEMRPLPSYVAINKSTGEVRTGRKAKESINESDDYEIFSSIKSVIDVDKNWYIAGKIWTPIDIAAELFKSLKERVKSRTEVNLEKTVLSVPVGFNSNKRNNVREAARKAGIDIEMFVSEPTAAFCSHYAELKKFQNIAVFDWGGGTLDVVVLKVSNGQVYELSSEGINIAGNDIDKKLAEKIHLKIARNRNSDLAFNDINANLRAKLLAVCERAKCNLSDEDLVKIQIASYGAFGPVIEKIDYDYFSLLIESEINQAMKCLHTAIVKAGLNDIELDCILCVGGSSKLRPLQEKLIEKYGKELVKFPRQAMWDIAEGAAIISARPGCYTLNKSIGMILSDGNYLPLLNEGQKLPCEENVITLATVDSTEKGQGDARFVFTDSPDEEKQSFCELLKVPLRGFADEILRVACYVDSDMIFKLKVCSNRMPDNVFKIWKYDKIKVSYDIEGANYEK